MSGSHVVNITDISREFPSNRQIYREWREPQLLSSPWQPNPDDRFDTIYSRELDPFVGVSSMDNKSAARRWTDGGFIGRNALWTLLRQSLNLQITGVLHHGIVCRDLM